ncbi:MAG: hypothetical protein ACK4WC_10485 [Rubrimonas sp.]
MKSGAASRCCRVHRQDAPLEGGQDLALEPCAQGRALGARTVLALIEGWIEACDDNNPYSELNIRCPARSPQRERRASGRLADRAQDRQSRIDNDQGRGRRPSLRNFTTFADVDVGKWWAVLGSNQ